MISGASSQMFQREWFEVKGNYGLIKPEYMDMFQKNLEAQQKEAARDYAGFTERMKETGSSVKLTEEQRKYLSEKFDPQKMSKKEYQAFLDKLCEFGVLDEADKEYAGYGIEGCDLDLTPLGRVRTGAYLTSAQGNPMGYTSAFSSSRGNALSWTRYLSSFQSWDPDSQSWRKTGEALLFGKLRDILEGISD